VSLAKAGYRVLTATDGAHAMKLCQSFPGTIHLVISDIIMPQLNGLELRAQLALCRPDLRVLLMSGYSQEELSRQDLSAEGIGFLEKPFRPEELVNRVRELLTAQAVA